ncbi:hypothetical protein WT22_16995 [Burkholderia territorii]|nr:hypothetical protein WT22_16995 [Burkholderia territorii]KWA30920.1 hypothetical protein WT40_21840 [Burkholderia territorii]
MYSYEDRVRAVELYLKLGKRVKATIRQLGYPTKNSLKAWCEEFEKSGDLQKECVRVKPKYSEEQKNQALAHYVNHGRSFSFTLRALGYAPSFMAAYNTRFAKPPKSDFNAHRPLRPDESLDVVLTWREPRKVTKSMTVQYDRVMYRKRLANSS